MEDLKPQAANVPKQAMKRINSKRANMGGDGGIGLRDVAFFKGSDLSSQFLKQILMHSENRKEEVSQLPSRKVCIVCNCSPKRLMVEEVHVYVVDVNEFSRDGWCFRSPAIRFTYDCFDAETFCVLGRTLYMFEAYKEEINPKSGTRVVTCQLPSLDTANLELEKSNLVEAPSLNFPKFFPSAIPTPDGKILVLSTSIDFNLDDKCDFEIYDPEEPEWQQLPSLCGDEWRYGRSFSSCEVRTYTFINNGPVFLLQTSFGLFTLEIKPPYDSKQWKRFDSSVVGHCPLPSLGQPYLLIEDVLCLTDHCMCEFGKTGFSGYPQLGLDGDDYLGAGGRAISLLDITENGEYFFCVLRAQLRSRIMQPHLTLNAYCIDLMKYKEKKDEEEKNLKFLPPDISVVRSFKIVLSPQSDDRFVPLDMFTIPAS